MAWICPICNFEVYPLRQGEVDLFARLPDIPLMQEGIKWDAEEAELYVQWVIFIDRLVGFTGYFPRRMCLHKDSRDGHRWKLRARGNEEEIDAIAAYFIRQADELKSHLCAKVAFNFCDQAIGKIQTHLVRPNIQDLATPYPSSPLVSEPFTE